MLLPGQVRAQRVALLLHQRHGRDQEHGALVEVAGEEGGETNITSQVLSSLVANKDFQSRLKLATYKS